MSESEGWARLAESEFVNKVYDDYVAPGRPVGKTLTVLAETINTALLPFEALIWGGDQLRRRFLPEVAERLHRRGCGAAVEPDLTVAGPTMELLKYFGHKDELRELLAGLLAASMDPAARELCHPAFVEVVRQLSPSDALAVQVLARLEDRLVVSEGGGMFVSESEKVGRRVRQRFCEMMADPLGVDPKQVNACYDNLLRLRIIQLETDRLDRSEVMITSFGWAFLEAAARPVADAQSAEDQR